MTIPKISEDGTRVTLMRSIGEVLIKRPAVETEQEKVEEEKVINISPDLSTEN